MSGVSKTLRLSVLAAALTMAGCGGWVRDTLTLSTKPWQRIPPAALPLTLPDSPLFPIVAARMRSTGDVYKTYLVVLGNPTTLAGENRLSMDVQTLPDSLFGALVQPPRVFPVPLYTSQTLAVTLAHEFPDMAVKVADGARRNRYGDYDYAVAQDEENTCVFAWQLISDHERILPERIEAVRMEYRVCGTARNPRVLLQPFETLVLSLPEGVLEAGGLSGL